MAQWSVCTGEGRSVSAAWPPGSQECQKIIDADNPIPVEVAWARLSALAPSCEKLEEVFNINRARAVYVANALRRITGTELEKDVILGLSNEREVRLPIAIEIR